MTVNSGAHVDLEFALPHAINLAEAGQSTQDKRTGMHVAVTVEGTLQVLGRVLVLR